MASIAGFGSNSRTNGNKVILNVYDLSDNEYLYPLGLGFYHSGSFQSSLGSRSCGDDSFLSIGVELRGQEYTYAGGAGVYSMEPKSAPRFRESIDLGIYNGTASQLDIILSSLRREFGPNEYSLMSKNCNCFADALVTRLLGHGIPGFVNRMAVFGSAVSCCLPPELVNAEAPVNQSASSSGRGMRRIEVGGGESAAHKSAPVFSGKGNRLGGGSSSLSSSSSAAERGRSYACTYS